QACADAGIAFIGPTPDAIRRMGNKLEAKAVMAAAGVPVIPGFAVEGLSEAQVAARARELGWPLLVKAAAGGGGKRMRIGAAAVTAGRAIGYRNAGTVEFVLAPDGRFYFLEVNTRLQVEHPVTEEITGLDLVRLQILVAQGEPLPLRQDDLVIRGHAIEARIYAEDPRTDFLPSTGTLVAWEEGRRPGIRR